MEKARMHFRTNPWLPILLLGFFSGTFHGIATAGPVCQRWAGKLVSSQGQVSVKRVNDGQWHPAIPSETFCPGDRLHVGESSRAAVVLSNEAVLRINQNSTLLFSGEEKKKAFLLELLEGAAHFFSRKPRSLEVATPFVNGVVEGTEFYVQVDPEETIFSVFRGQVRTVNEKGELILTNGQAAFVRKDHPPELRITAHPRDAVSWALYYPSVGTSASENFQKELLSADRLLRVGDVDRARAIIDGILAADPRNSHALALNAVIALAQDRKDEAGKLARRAVQADPRSTPARIALSYVQQARFDVRGARETLRAAVGDDPENALAWARLSEMWLASGYPDEAQAAAHKAQVLSPETSRTQTVLGYAYLSQVAVDKAKAAFQSAIRLDQADPLPRLGLGLAQIREGDLKDGRGQIEIAAALDPGNALIRSYLGKAFYEEKDHRHARRQYAIAEELDPKDPTPYLYDAIRKQSENRPVEALQDLQKSVALNNNRAVYRSRLLLDEDLATRSAGLGKIYDTLGFQQQGLVQGYRSVNLDPGNQSAHRFLSDAYADMPRYEVARASEWLQAQLLQPINVTPVHPLMGETDTYIFKNTGPAAVTYNEYDPLFLRDRLELQLSGFAGNQSTFGNEAIQSGVLGKLSYSLGNYHLATDGYRDNDDVETNVFTAFVQGMLTPSTSLQAEYRYQTRTHGDLTLRFDDDFSTGFREDQSLILGRIGVNHRFSPNSILIGSLIHKSLGIDQHDDDSPGLDSLSTDLASDGWLAEMQHILKTDKVNLVSGIGRMDLPEQTYSVATFPETVTVIEMPPLPPLEVVIPPQDVTLLDETDDLKDDIVYVYSRLQLHPGFRLTAGLSADFMKYGDRLEEDQVNPKLGFTWQVGERTVIRAAGLRCLSKSVAFAQTIEPTQVEGFNQFFDDVALSDVRQYGAALDHQFNPNLSSGVSWVQRNLDVPVFEGITTFSRDWEENTSRAYLYWSPLPTLALSAEYVNEWFAIDFPISSEVSNFRTQLLPLNARWFYPCGLSLDLKGTYVDQYGEYFSRSSFTEESPELQTARDRFWVFDLQIDYRLAKGYGLFALGVKNLFDESFALQEIDPQITGANFYALSPERFVYTSLTLYF
jgi:tetratricopeptide (TPR) repeat protein